MYCQPPVDIINTTLELSDIADKWFYDEEHDAWGLEDILYTLKSTTPKFQRMSIYVPGEYMSAPGVINENGTKGGYTAKTAPIIFQNNSAGYMQMPHTWLGGPRDTSGRYLAAGMVFVTCGNRGSESRDADGVLCGKSPANLIDLKTGIRFLRHNRACVPGDTDRIISTGWSAGGAMSSLLAITGNHPDYTPYLEENGAFLEESDAVYASQIYCPIVDLDHADLAYEWMFHEDKQCEDSPAGPAEVMTPFKEAVSSLLKKEYIDYFNGLDVKNPQTGEQLVFEKDGRSGSAYDYLMAQLDASATKYLTKLSIGELDAEYSVSDYISGNYTLKKEVMGPGPDEEGPDGGPGGPGPMDHFAGPGVAVGGPEGAPAGGPGPMDHFAGPGVAVGAGMPDEPDPCGTPQEPPTLGDLMARPPKGTPQMPAMEPRFVDEPGDEKTAWLSWDGEKAAVKDLDTYILHHRRRMKPCTSFDTFPMDSGENRVLGGNTEETHYQHFDVYIPAVLDALKKEFPEETAQYAPAYAAVREDAAQLEKKRLYNPFGYLKSDEKADTAQYARIRVGAQDADTSFSVSMTLACLMAQNGFDVDYALVWDQPHCEADYEGEVVAWIRSITQ